MKEMNIFVGYVEAQTYLCFDFAIGFRIEKTKHFCVVSLNLDVVNIYRKARSR